MAEMIIMLIFVLAFGAAVWIYAYRIGVRASCPNCAQRQTGWSTQCPRCGVVFKDWKE